jgi:hypothetical protein
LAPQINPFRKTAAARKPAGRQGAKVPFTPGGAGPRDALILRRLIRLSQKACDRREPSDIPGKRGQKRGSNSGVMCYKRVGQRAGMKQH